MTLVLVLLSACHAKQQAAKPPADSQQSPLTPVAQEIERRGYHAKKQSLVVSPNGWEVATFRMRGKRVSAFRADQPQPGSTAYFCRFSFFEETYDSVDDARHRLANIHLPDPAGGGEEYDYLSAMRTGFRVGKVTYVLQTDAIIFWDEVQRFAKQLAEATPGSELTRATIAAPSKKLLDASDDRVCLVFA